LIWKQKQGFIKIAISVYYMTIYQVGDLKP